MPWNPNQTNPTKPNHLYLFVPQKLNGENIATKDLTLGGLYFCFSPSLKWLITDISGNYATQSSTSFWQLLLTHWYHIIQHFPLPFDNTDVMKRGNQLHKQLPVVHIIFPCLYRDPDACNIMAEGFCFMPLGLVRLRTFRLSAWVT